MVFTFKSVDAWLGTQLWRLRMWWVSVYFSDVVVEGFNNIQLGIFRRRNQIVSRILAGVLAFSLLILPWIIVIIKSV